MRPDKGPEERKKDLSHETASRGKPTRPDQSRHVRVAPSARFRVVSIQLGTCTQVTPRCGWCSRYPIPVSRSVLALPVAGWRAQVH